MERFGVLTGSKEIRTAMTHRRELGSSKFQHRSEWMGHSEVSQVKIDVETVLMPHLDDVKAFLQKDLKQDFDSICQNTDFTDFMEKAVKNKDFIGHVQAMCYDQDFVECVNNLCQKREVMEARNALGENNKDFLNSLEPLLQDQLIKHNVNALQETPPRRLLVEVDQEKVSNKANGGRGGRGGTGGGGNCDSNCLRITGITLGGLVGAAAMCAGLCCYCKARSSRLQGQRSEIEIGRVS